MPLRNKLMIILVMLFAGMTKSITPTLPRAIPKGQPRVSFGCGAAAPGTMTAPTIVAPTATASIRVTPPILTPTWDFAWRKSEAPRGKPRGIFAEPCEAKNAIFTRRRQSGGFLAKKGKWQVGGVVVGALHAPSDRARERPGYRRGCQTEVRT